MHDGYPASGDGTLTVGVTASGVRRRAWDVT
jgi:hypothetical protein